MFIETLYSKSWQENTPLMNEGAGGADAAKPLFYILEIERSIVQRARSGLVLQSGSEVGAGTARFFYRKASGHEQPDACGLRGNAVPAAVTIRSPPGGTAPSRNRRRRARRSSSRFPPD